jgi:hypothetical protein
METWTISDNFRDKIGTGWQVVAALFTTYNFEPDFFEQEVIPLMLDKDLAYSGDVRIKRLQVREALAQTALPIDVFYDIDIFRQQQPMSPAMEYLHHGIRGDQRAFHAKLTFLLLQNAEGRQVLRVGAGSANLTGAGWWENIECQHWEDVVSGAVSRRFLGQLRDDIAWLAKRRTNTERHAHSALNLIQAYLVECRASNAADTVSYYGLTSLGLRQVRRPPFFKFLLDAQDEQCGHYNRWSLEIISPYFAETADFDGHEYFFRDLKVASIRILLPFNGQGEALCRQDYYERLGEHEHIEWSAWAPEVGKVLGIGNQPLRKTHAKIYHFHNGKQSWAFIGSVNFTHRATSDNQEAGFFVKLPPGTTLLKSLNGEPEKWCSEQELSSGNEKEADVSLPVVELLYDWKSRALTAAIQGDESVVLYVMSPERKIIVAESTVTRQPVLLDCHPEQIEKLLTGSGFLHVAGCWGGGQAFPEHVALVQQVNWTHKPLDLPALTPLEIMQIYAGLSAIRRNQIIEYLKEREFSRNGLISEVMGGTGYEHQARQFFAEYAELFHAFRNLRQRLSADFEAERFNQLDYYLSGRGLDSLPTLLDSLFEKDRNLDAVTVYLALLCLIQIYMQPNYRSRLQVDVLLSSCLEKASYMESSGQLQLINEDPERSLRFFRWYREKFFCEFQRIETDVSHAAL